MIPPFYIVKLGFTGVYIVFLILLKNIDCGHSLKLLGEAVLTNTHNLCFEQEYEKYQNFLSENFPFLVVKFSIYLKKVCFGNEINLCFLVQEVPLGLLNPLTLVMLNKLRRHTHFQLSANQIT